MPDIRNKALALGRMEDLPFYTDETLKRAAAQGLDPAGNPLEYPMSGWTMSELDLI